MKIERHFDGDTDRYAFDWSLKPSAGWAQVDTSQDASYYGTWANARRLQIVCYCEGDITIQTTEDPEEFADEMRNLKHWNEKNGWRFKGVDCMCNDAIEREFRALGIDDLFHASQRAQIGGE